MEPHRRKTILEIARAANKQGHPMKANNVIQQLLWLANDNIGAASAYWSDMETESYAPHTELGFTPNNIRDRLSKTVADILEQRVERAVILHPDLRRAAYVFKGFVDSVAYANWNDKQEFGAVSESYDATRDLVEKIRGSSQTKISSARLEVYELDTIPTYLQ